MKVYSLKGLKAPFVISKLNTIMHYIIFFIKWLSHNINLFFSLRASRIFSLKWIGSCYKLSWCSNQSQIIHESFKQCITVSQLCIKVCTCLWVKALLRLENLDPDVTCSNKVNLRFWVILFDLLFLVCTTEFYQGGMGLLNKSPKFYYYVFLFVGLTTLRTLIEFWN